MPCLPPRGRSARTRRACHRRWPGSLALTSRADTSSATGRGWALSAKATARLAGPARPRAPPRGGGGRFAVVSLAVDGVWASQRSNIQRPSPPRSTASLGVFSARDSRETVRSSTGTCKPLTSSLPRLTSDLPFWRNASCSSASGPAVTVRPVAFFVCWVGLPLHAQGAGELAGHRGLQVLRHIGRRQLQRQRFGGDLHLGVLGGGFAFKCPAWGPGCLRATTLAAPLALPVCRVGGTAALVCTASRAPEGHGLLQRQARPVSSRPRPRARKAAAAGWSGQPSAPCHRARWRAPRSPPTARRLWWMVWRVARRLPSGATRARATGQLCQVQPPGGVALGVQYGLEQFHLGQVPTCSSGRTSAMSTVRRSKASRCQAFAVGHLHIAGLHWPESFTAKRGVCSKPASRPRPAWPPSAGMGRLAAGSPGRAPGPGHPSGWGVGVPGLRKRRALGRRVKTAAFQREGQPGLHAHFFLSDSVLMKARTAAGLAPNASCPQRCR